MQPFLLHNEINYSRHRLLIYDEERNTRVYVKAHGCRHI